MKAAANGDQTRVQEIAEARHGEEGGNVAEKTRALVEKPIASFANATTKMVKRIEDRWLGD